MNKPHALAHRQPARLPSIHAAMLHPMSWPVIAGRNYNFVPASVLKWSTCLTSGPPLPMQGLSLNAPIPGVAPSPMRRPDPAPPPQIVPSAQNPMQREAEPIVPGTLRNGNPRGNPNAAPRCGAKTRAGCPCKAPAMQNGRCRMHGGAATGPSAGGRARIAAARTIHGGQTAAMRAFGRGVIATKRRGTVLNAMVRAGLKLEDMAAPIRHVRPLTPAGRPLPRKASKPVRDRCFAMRELMAMAFTMAEVRALLTAIGGAAQNPLHREPVPNPAAPTPAAPSPANQTPPRQSREPDRHNDAGTGVTPAQNPLHREAPPTPAAERRVCQRPRNPLPCRHHAADTPFPAATKPLAPWGDAEPPLGLTRLGRDVPDPGREGPDLGLPERQVHPLGRCGLMPKRHARPPLGFRADRPSGKPAAAVGADVPQFGVHAFGAEGALVGADARDRGVRRQIPVAPFAIRSDLQGHGVTDPEQRAKHLGISRPVEQPRSGTAPR